MDPTRPQRHVDANPLLGKRVVHVTPTQAYPASLLLLAQFKRRTPQRAAMIPKVSFIITAHNESKRIVAKLDNTLAQDYPADRFEILVASDCSDDSTDASALVSQSRRAAGPRRRAAR